MKTLTIFFLLILSIGINTNKEQANNNYIVNNKIEEPKLSDGFTIKDDLYDLHFQIETTDNNKHSLVISIQLYKGSHYISPYAKRNFKGKFYMDLGSYTHLDFEGDIVESPRSVEEFDSHPFVNGTVNWVRVNTSYKQTLQVKSKEDFEVFGKLRFTIEPRCSLEEIPFAISYKDGEMKITFPAC